MSISNEAIEAAAVVAAMKAVWARQGERVDPAQVSIILEAAASHILANERESARNSREQARKLEAVTSIAVRLGASMQGEDRGLSEELYAAMGQK